MVIFKDANQFKALIGVERPSLYTIIGHFNQKLQHDDRGVQLLQLYLDMVNHELRTPITCIQAAVEILHQNNSLSDFEKNAMHQLINRNIQRLIQSIEILFKM